MTNEEAKQIIATWLVSSKGAKGQRGYIEGWFDEEDVEAFRMAIDALSTYKLTGHIITKSGGISDMFQPTIWAICSECRKPIDPFDKFCRHCGAKIKENNE